MSGNSQAPQFRRGVGFCAFVIFVMTLCGVTIAAKEPQESQSADRHAAGSLRKQVERLVGQLGADSRQTRISAERDLLKLGPAILPFLPPPELTGDLSVREAVGKLRVKLEREQARRSVRPSHVTMTGTHTLAEILRLVTKQTGNAIDASRLSKTKLATRHAVNFQKQTFWRVVSRLEQQAGLDFSPGRNGESLRVEQRTTKTSQPPLAVDDRSAFRVEVSRVEWKPLFGDEKHRLLRVQWNLTAEPRLRPLFLKYTGRSLSVFRKNGTPLAPFSPDAKYELPATDRSRAISLQADFLVPVDVTSEEIQLRGTLQMLTAAGQERITFRNVTKSVNSVVRRGGVSVALRSVRVSEDDAKKTAAQLAVGIAVTYDVGGPAFESHRTWMFHNLAELELPDGKRIPREPGVKTNIQRDGAVAVEYNFRLDAAAAKNSTFVYVAPTLLIDVPVEFSFSRISVSKLERKSP